MGIMLENTIAMEKGPLHQHDPNSLDIPTDTGTTTNINNINKQRGKIFPPPFFHPDVDVELPSLPSTGYALCHECPTSIASKDTLPFEQSSENERSSIPVIRTPVILVSGDGGDTVMLAGASSSTSASPITTTRASSAVSTVSAPSSVPPPTADDYANLFFCESSEEEEARANLYPESISAATTTNDTSTSLSSITIASHRHRPSATITSTLTTTTKAKAKHKKKQRQKRPVSFGTFIPTIHLLHDTPPSHAMTHDERSTRWFSRGDLEMLKSSAQGSIQEMRARIRSRSSGMSCNSGSVSKNNSNTNNNDTNESSSSNNNSNNNNSIITDRSQFRTMMSQMEDESNSSIRGLEHRVFRRKHARKTLIRDVLECQAHVVGLARFGHGMDGKERAKLLAGVSRERSGRAKGVAVLDAQDDCKEVYGYGDEDGGNGGGEEGVGVQRVRKRQKKKSPRLVSF
eukprot:CAMPEP_0201633554 /NCGR_PEP_ID=MMETSP0493-20130528/6825_1 /ASSEMBLY_ACC=CAM_ASM_000838 /TAXON_ID=420259 /ORGANISM="Thalassiosira gravida, Strain GMp14c1" /LENGTH=458 /DNA_ID=CAMNT_0048105283 /DNA_START=227 /DNA_END=1603 /DNA_ORIENTATION=+